MQRITQFGFSSVSCRSETGALLGRELEKIYDFLRQHGLLVAECFDGCIVLSHPDLFENAINIMKDLDFHPVVIASNIHILRENTMLSIAATRVLESFSPGPLIVADVPDNNQNNINVTVPDSFDLRDICYLYNGCVKAFIKTGTENIPDVVEGIKNTDYQKYGFSKVGVLESPNYDGDYPPSKATMVQISSPGVVKCILNGDLDLELIKAASKTISIWEIGEWT